MAINEKTLSNVLQIERASPFSIAQNLVIRLLNKMKKGTLTLALPDGSYRTFGNGHGINAEVRILNNAFFLKALMFGDIGLGESFVDGDWESTDVTSVLRWLIENNISDKTSGRFARSMDFLAPLNRLVHKTRKNSRLRSSKNVRAHYDLSNEFFALFLDPGMTYSSALFDGSPLTLEEAQRTKIKRILNLLGVKPGDHILEIGTGWGSLASIAAREYDCRVTTTTISHQQFAYSKERFRKECLDGVIRSENRDYRDLTGSFDHVVSVEMLEAVGDRYYETFFKKCYSLLKPGGKFGFQVITYPSHKYERYKNRVDWVQKHVFPGGHLPSVDRIDQAIRRTGRLERFDFKDMGIDYAQTLEIWRDRFFQNKAQIRALGFGEDFIRKWIYYFEYCRAGFLSRNVSAAQLVYTKN